VRGLCHPRRKAAYPRRVPPRLGLPGPQGWSRSHLLGTKESKPPLGGRGAPKVGRGNPGGKNGPSPGNPSELGGPAAGCPPSANPSLHNGARWRRPFSAVSTSLEADQPLLAHSAGHHQSWRHSPQRRGVSGSGARPRFSKKDRRRASSACNFDNPLPTPLWLSTGSTPGASWVGSTR
jgi:hypothetical protein